MDMWMILLVLSVTSVIFIFWIVIVRILLRCITNYAHGDKHKGKLIVGFFHPYCNAGGGGERVLWCAIRCLQNEYADVHCVVYTGDKTTAENILTKAEHNFSIAVDRSRVDFIFLKARWLVEASTWPRLTLIGQSLGSLVLGLEALTNLVPDVYIDSMGYAFTLPLFRVLGAQKVACYVHYPTISTDMLGAVSSARPQYNNAAAISRSRLLTGAKLLYYRAFASGYALVGRASHVTLVNSSWTRGHIASLWGGPPRVVYPPCNVEDLLKIPLDREPADTDGDPTRPILVVSVSQFRPEKDHPLQLRAFAELLRRLDDAGDARPDVRLLLVGSCRNAEDESRVQQLRDLSQELGVGGQVVFHVNVDYGCLKRLFAEATIGLHTMWNEHFGIGIVELMAAGVIVVAHNSGGPKLDIVTDPQEGEEQWTRTGFLADDVQSYAACMSAIVCMSRQQRLAIAEAARASVKRFSEKVFDRDFLSAISPLFRTKDKSL